LTSFGNCQFFGTPVERQPLFGGLVGLSGTGAGGSWSAPVMRVPHGLSDSGRNQLTFDNQHALGARIAVRHLQHPVMPIFAPQPETQAPCTARPAGPTSFACETVPEYRTR